MNAKRKQSIGEIVQAVFFMVRHIKSPTHFVYAAIALLPIATIAGGLIAIYLSGEIVGLVVAGLPLRPFLLLLGMSFLGLSITVAGKIWLSTWFEGWGVTHRLEVFNRFAFSLVTKDYPQVIGEEADERQSRAVEGMYNSTSVFQAFPILATDLLTALLGLIVFGGLIFTLEPLFLVIIAAILALQILAAALSKRYHEKTNEEIGKLYSRSEYLTFRVGDLKAAKDMRVFGLRGWLVDRQKQNARDLERMLFRRRLHSWLGTLILLAGTTLLTALTYLRLIPQVEAGTLSISVFVFTVGAVVQVSRMASDLVSSAAKVVEQTDTIAAYRDFLEEPPRFFHGEGASLPDSAPEIRFENVSFSYEPGGRKILSDLNFTIRAGEKIALVGPNGAGKTTLISLLAGLLIPSEGTIYIDGVEQNAFDRESYYRLFSVIFQTAPLLDLTAKEMIVLDEPWDEARFAAVVRESEFDAVAARLPLGYETPLVKVLDERAVTLSGGEMQKLRLAQALYRQAHILILDEPTSALDPLAEEAIYREYYQLSREKTSFFISHRLSSTRFCDRVLYLEDGQIRESGRHEELMAAGGNYRAMYDAQAFFYQEKLDWERSEQLQKEISARFGRREGEGA